MSEPVGLGYGGQPVVDRMGRREATGLEADPGQQGVRLDDLLHRRGDDVVAHRLERGQRVVPQDVPRQLGQGGAGERGQATGHRGGRGAAGGAGLQPGGQRVADAGGQELGGRVGDHLGVHQHEVGVLRENRYSSNSPLSV